VGFVIAASLAFATGGAFMKAAAGFTRPWPSAAVVALFVVGAFLLARAVVADGLSTAYTYGLGVEAILSIVVGMCWFGERLSPVQLIGISLIIVGVAGVRLG
jgi:multidrug transporter EmrE-like cation transporter